MSPTNPLLCRLFFRSGRGYRCISKNYNSTTKNSKYIKVSINFVITITNILDIYYINECVVPTCCQCFLCHSQEPRIVGLVSPIERCHSLQGLCHRLPRKNENLTRQQNQQDLRQQMKYYEKITWNNIWKLNFHTFILPSQLSYCRGVSYCFHVVPLSDSRRLSPSDTLQCL